MERRKHDFTILKDDASGAQIEEILKRGNDLVLLASKHEYFEADAGRTAIAMMKKYPARKVFVTSPVSVGSLASIREKANSGASLTETYLFAESLAE